MSGKVNRVSYQHGEPDAFYSYYAHGPLARVVLGEQQVQGINYAYTLQGWLKAINPDIYTGGSFTLRPDSVGNVVAATAYHVLLNYFNGDYTSVSGVPGTDNGVSAVLGSGYRPLFNGNISSMGVSVRKLDSALLYNYQYDQLNRLVHMDAWRRTGTVWSAISSTSSFREDVSYDPNGNILTYHRDGKAATGLEMDKMKYFYTAGTNKLDYIHDTVPAGAYSTDIDAQSAGNYRYDSIGELVHDEASGIDSISWTVYGKIAKIFKGDSTLLYTYDPSGNRISKSVVHGGDTLTTWYVRDAQGNVLSVYTYGDPAVHGKELTQTELHIYGSSRLGIWKSDRDVYKPVSDSIVLMPLLGTADSVTFNRGNKFFELTNHLGNVLATISDKRFGVTPDSVVRYFVPDVVSAQDYYPFGMLQPGRGYAQNGNGYRYGFNGKENDNEVKGTGDQIDYGMRVYDPRAGRFLSVDPLTPKYPWYTPYQFAGNKPIAAADLDGMEDWMKTQNNEKQQAAVAKIDATRVQLLPISKIQTLNATPFKDQVQKYQQEQYKIQRYQEMDYNDDGSKPAWMRLAENKTWKSFSGNLALPMLDGLTAVDGAVLLINISKLAPVIETWSAARKIAYFRDAFGVVDDEKNLALLEGQIGNDKIRDIAISGKSNEWTTGTVAELPKKSRIFETKVIGGKDRANDSEAKLLENFAETYKNTPNVEGTLKLTSQWKYCGSCSDVIEQFNKMFPKVKLEFQNGTGNYFGKKK